VVPGSRRIRASFVFRGIFETGFGESATREAGSGEAGAGDGGLILCQEGVESVSEIFRMKTRQLWGGSFCYLVRSEESPISLYRRSRELAHRQFGTDSSGS
jgi:hypothetical protein